MSSTPSLGASGAIFGLLGSLLYFGYHYRVYFGSVIIGKVVPVIIINLAIGFMIPSIDNFAHIGGLIGGFLISKALGINSKDKKSDKINGFILTAIYVIFLVILVIIGRG
jgi:rhomboid protease GluP